ncbi:alpha/beta fold hydrolase [Oryzibacter oryziterrae]|uniref:alpha/beta fold hydrolase n=1 Tax=Oryzibacter oryziterrae TaxID=2766474 RepID=UPI001F21DBCA|nr:alpha/beta fold hydrolase [Oryzibacter oryziterrae]
MRHRLIRFGASDAADDADARMSVEVFRQDEGARDKLALVVHGRNGLSHAPHMLKIIRPYVAQGYVVVAPNCTGSAWNDSAGEERDFLLASHTRDALRAADWALGHADEIGWTGDYFALAGHSMGGYSAARLAATDLRDRTRHLLLVSPFTSGARQLEARKAQGPEALAILAREVPRAIAEWPEHDIFPLATRLTLPVAVVAGVLDPVTPLANVREIAAVLPHLSELKILEQASHCLEGGYYRSELTAAVAALEAAAAA